MVLKGLVVTERMLKGQLLAFWMEQELCPGFSIVGIERTVIKYPGEPNEKEDYLWGGKVRFKIILMPRIGHNSGLHWSRKNQCANTRWLDSGVCKCDSEVLRTKYELMADPSAKKIIKYPRLHQVVWCWEAVTLLICRYLLSWSIMSSSSMIQHIHLGESYKDVKAWCSNITKKALEELSWKSLEERWLRDEISTTLKYLKSFCIENKFIFLNLKGRKISVERFKL